MSNNDAWLDLEVICLRDAQKELSARNATLKARIADLEGELNTANLTIADLHRESEAAICDRNAWIDEHDAVVIDLAAERALSARLREVLSLALSGLAEACKCPPDWCETKGKKCTATKAGDAIITALALTPAQAAEEARLRDEVVNAMRELLEVAELRGDCDLPAPPNDPKLWGARMADAWRDAFDALAALDAARQGER